MFSFDFGLSCKNKIAAAKKHELRIINGTNLEEIYNNRNKSYNIVKTFDKLRIFAVLSHVVV